MNSNYKVPYPDVFISEDKQSVEYLVLDKRTKKLSKDRVCDVIRINKIIENIDDDTVMAEISFLFLGKEKSIMANRDEYMNIYKILKFQKYGMDVLESNAEVIVLHLKNEEYRAKYIYQHSKLGFSEYNSKRVFKHYQCIGSELQSTYAGNYEIKPTGDREVWFEMFINEVQGYAPLELICLISLSSSVLGYIGENLGLDNIVCHLTGNSTTGKSTAMKLAISMFGYPDVKKTGLFTSYNGTANALIKSLAGIKGIPVAIDEISMANNKNFGNFVYKLANGVDKNRLNRNSELREKETWLTTILSNGEESIVASSSNAGIHNRVFEFDGISWTKGATNAENIKKVILNNYGFVGCEFVEYLMSQDTSDVLEIFENCKKRINKLFKSRKVEDNFIDRRINRHAIFLTTAILFERAFGIELQIDEILGLLITVELESIQKRNFDKTVVDYLADQISINIKKFNVYSSNILVDLNIKEPELATAEYWGKIKMIASGLEVEMNPTVFEKLIEKGGFKNSITVLKELKISGHLDCEEGKMYRKRKDNTGKLSKVYVIKLMNEDEDPSLNIINSLIDSVSDFQTRSLLEIEKERLKRKFQESTENEG